jgi:hypothetical protein
MSFFKIIDLNVRLKTIKLLMKTDNLSYFVTGKYFLATAPETSIKKKNSKLDFTNIKNSGLSKHIVEEKEMSRQD